MSAPATWPAWQTPTAETAQPVVVVAAQQPAWNGLAIASLVLSLCGLAVLPIVLGHVALVQLRRGGRGHGLALTGVVIGYLTLAAWVVGLLVVGGTVLWATSA